MKKTPIKLPNGCRASALKVHPLDWEKVTASTKKDWYIHYRFFDPSFAEKHKYGLPVIVKGMNKYKTLTERRQFTKWYIDKEIKDLQDGHNPITKGNAVYEGEISKHTPFLSALEYSLKNHHGDPDTKIDIRSSLKYISIAAKTLGYDRLPVGDIEKKHIKFILEEMANIKTYTNNKGKEVPKVWNDRMYNHTRAILSLLMSPLEEIDAIKINPVKHVKKRIKLKKIRVTPTEKERELIRGMRYTNYPFFRFIQIFHHSGGRIKEILAVKKKDVTIDLSHKNPEKHVQAYKITVKKGGKHQEMMRDIKDKALTYWQEILELSENDNQYLYSKGLVPGNIQIRREQVTRRWNLHAKKKLGIKADFYSLKHLNVTEMMDILRDEKEVAKLTGHNVDREVNTLADSYDINNRKRKNDQLKRANNDI